MPLVLFLEVLRYAAWILVLAGLARSIGVRRPMLLTVDVVLGVALAGALGIALVPDWSLTASAQPRLLTGVGIGLALLGLVILEQVYRNSREQLRQALKFLVIALGVIFAYDLYVFAQAQFLGDIEPDSWAARGLVTALTVPMIAIAARRNPHWALSIFVSRHAVFYTASLFGVALYLAGVAFGGYLISHFGGAWGRTARLVFFVGAVMVLVALLASPDLRRRLRVFLAKHFFRARYDHRVEWLRFIQTLSVDSASAAPTTAASMDAGDGSRPDPNTNAIRAIAQIIDSPGGVLFLRGEEDGRFVASAAWPTSRRDLRAFQSLAPDDELVQFLERRQWVVDVDEHHRSPELYDNIALPAFFDPPTPHRVVLPLLEGTSMLGFLVLDEPPPPFQPNFEDRDLLKTVGRHVATYIAQHEADRKLAESRQFEAYHRLTAFVMHDLKNLAAQLSLIVANAERHKRNPEFVDDAISTVANSTERMQRLIEQLQGREVRSHARHAVLAEIVRRACERCSLREPVPAVEIAADPSVAADPERLTAVIEHLIRNAQDATPATGTVSVRLHAPDDFHGVITIVDSGSGMTQDFVNTRLFKPFDSTKGSKGMGIGAYQAREFVQGLGGTLLVRSAPGAGTTFEIRLPTTTA
jgi:putative PEP-CTERM system histidine kinase